ncbi:MAG: permease-like cell division protein FtsX [Bacilli bacterium]|nr:permease-like cell division protein FtsX [Bacilli bacterium]
MMKLIRMLSRGIRDAFKSVFRNFSLSIASVSCISITLVIVAIAIVASWNVNSITDSIKKDVTIVVFIDNQATDLDLEKIDEELREIKNIESVVLKTKEQEKKEMMEESEIFESIMGDWDEDESPLKDSFLIKVTNLEEIKDTVTKIKKIDKVSVVNYGESMVEKLLSAFNVIEKVTVAVVIALVIVNIFLIINTIKLTIFSRKREISIMRLVGASNFSIKYPFVVEGMVIGMIGSIIPILLVVYGYTYLYSYFDGELFSSLIKLVEPQPFVYYVSLIVLGIGMVVGMIGSSSAVRKYLKV